MAIAWLSPLSTGRLPRKTPQLPSALIAARSRGTVMLEAPPHVHTRPAREIRHETDVIAVTEACGRDRSTASK
eukprot:7568046-Pyramimonas_sp.AAC.1